MITAIGLYQLLRHRFALVDRYFARGVSARGVYSAKMWNNITSPLFLFESKRYAFRPNKIKAEFPHHKSFFERGARQLSSTQSPSVS
jgi:hypothetical protein